MQDPRHGIAVLVFDIDQHGWAHGVEIPDIMGDKLKVTGVTAGIQVQRHQRVGVKIVAGTHGAVEVRRRIADHEEDPVRRQIDRGVLPHASAETLSPDRRS